MILKIKRYQNDTLDWLVIDGIKNFDFGIREVDKNQPRISTNIWINDFRNHPFKKVGAQFEPLCSGTLTMNDGSCKSVEFDTMAYLCNDEGKTIEKIVANHDIGDPQEGDLSSYKEKL
jgi:hypothetical protein